MISILRSTILISTAISFFSCNAKSQSNVSDNDKIFQTFNQWKEGVLKEGSYIETCPTVEEFEAITDTSKYEKLSNANILPKKYSVSFGDFNGDSKQDALFSFPNYICYGNALGASPGWLSNRSGIFVLVTSNYEGYKISNSEIELLKIEEALRTNLKVSGVSISLTTIDGEGLISGTCKVWSNENSDNFLGLCCPDKLLSITINNDNHQISFYINENEKEGFQIKF